MAKRRVWSSLTSAYRTRLMRSGITQQTYEAGASLKAARGHAETPEHPEEAIKKPSRYNLYRQKAAALQGEIEQRKADLWDSRFKYHDLRQRQYVKGKMPDVKAPGILKMRAALKMTDDEWEQKVLDAAMSEGNGGIDDDWKFLFYH
jgi:hypothetical protein